jgi:nicotinate-nucleotide adenylyltransferase
MTDNEIFSEKVLDDLRAEVMKRMSAKRFSHTLGVEKKAEELCALFAPEKTGMMRAAALLHDLTKELKTEEQLVLCERYGIVPDADTLAAPKLFHSMTAAAVIADKFPHLAVPELVHAVSVHTAGSEEMNICDRILYLADYIEPTRKQPVCRMRRESFYRELSESDDKLKTLNLHLLAIAEDTKRYVLQNNAFLHSKTDEIIMSLQKELNNI